MRHWPLLLFCLAATACDGRTTDRDAGSVTPADDRDQGEAGASDGSPGVAKPGGEQPLTEAAFSERLVQLMCDDSQPCCGRDGLGYDARRCADFVLSQYAAAAPGAMFDGVAAAACIAELRAARRECVIAPDVEARPRACGRIWVVTATKNPGAACSFSGECREPMNGSAWCDGDGRCAAAVAVQPGERCAPDGPTTYVCERSSCLAEPATGALRCVAPAQPGARCDATLPCTAGSQCKSTGAGLSVCVTLPALGEACDEGTCRDGAHCREGLCVAPLELGAPCDPSGSRWQCESVFCNPTNGRCDGVSIVSPALCGDDGLGGTWTASDIPLASIDFNTQATAAYTLSAGTVTLTVNITDAAGPSGLATFSGRYDAEQLGTALVLDVEYSNASLSDGAGAALPVSAGVCQSGCQGFVFGDGAPYPEPCVCKQQALGFVRRGDATLEGLFFGVDVDFKRVR